VRKRINEATGPYVHKEVDPALLTAEEYERLVNPQQKGHPSTAYDWSVTDPARHRPSREFYEKPLRRITINGIDFEFRMHVDDRHAPDKRYVKTDPNGHVLRDEKGNALYLSPEEVKQRVKPRYQYDIGVFTERDGFVGGAQDEWGTLLIHVGREYRGFGLGTILGKMAWTLVPTKNSGGFTPAGKAAFYRIHREMVRDYLKSGMYSHLVKTGQVTLNRVKAIVASARVDLRPKSSNRNLRPDPSDYLLMAGEYGDFYVYDRKLADFGDDVDDHFRETMIKGMIYVAADDRFGRIKSFGADTDSLKRFLLLLAASYAKREGVELVVEADDVPFLDQKRIKVIGDQHTKAGYFGATVRLIGKPVDWSGLAAEEERFRRRFDKHDEFKNAVQEMAYAKFRVIS